MFGSPFLELHDLNMFDARLLIRAFIFAKHISDFGVPMSHVAAPRFSNDRSQRFYVR